VLPFANMSGDPDQEYFADGMVEDIITALSRARWLFVIARNSSFTYKGKVVDTKQVGRELGVRYVLEGSVRKAGVRLRITGQLIDAMTGAHLWADRFDGSMEDVFELQDKVALSVAGVVEPALLEAEIRRSTARPTSDLTAYDLYLHAFPLMAGGVRSPRSRGWICFARPSRAIPIAAPRSSARRGAPANSSQAAGRRIPRPTGAKRSISFGGRSRRPLTIPRCSYGPLALSISSERTSVARSRCSTTRLPSIRATPSVGSGAVS
jgi:TolB-like protein